LLALLGLVGYGVLKGEAKGSEAKGMSELEYEISVNIMFVK
jgi:hypothetical protein